MNKLINALNGVNRVYFLCNFKNLLHDLKCINIELYVPCEESKRECTYVRGMHFAPISTINRLWGVGFRFMVIKATINNISVISCRSVTLVEET